MSLVQYTIGAIGAMCNWDWDAFYDEKDEENNDDDGDQPMIFNRFEENNDDDGDQPIIFNKYEDNNDDDGDDQQITFDFPVPQTDCPGNLHKTY